ncbi:MAG TPA: tyrosine-type recombinase/integrase [Chloroflexia bacterium]|nr:tyrosine-type recombinase/integrase [Chloroflexia bacterium]
MKKSTTSRNLAQVNTEKNNKTAPSKTGSVNALFASTRSLPGVKEGVGGFSELVESWLAYCQADGLSPETLQDYSDKVSKFGWWWQEHTGYSEELGGHPQFVTVKEAREYAAYLREPRSSRWGSEVPPAKEQLSPASISSYGRAVKVFFSWLEREGFIDKTPFNKSVRFTNRHKQDRVIKCVEEEGLAKLFAVLNRPERLATFVGQRDLAIVALLLDSGIRLGELLSLEVKDLDLGHNRCTVRGKTGQRCALFSEACRSALCAYLQHEQFQYCASRNGSGRNPLWLTADGEPLSYYGCEAIIRRLRRESGVHFHAHMLRHTFATTMAGQGVNVFDLKGLMGHTSILTTQIYVQQNVEHLAAVHKPRSPLTTFSKVGSQIHRRRGRPRQAP